MISNAVIITFLICGAAATAIACAVAKLIIESGECKIEDRPQFLARQSHLTAVALAEAVGDGGSILHSKFSIHTAVFLFFATIATLSAQKPSGTNDPPRGAVSPRSMPSVPAIIPVAVDSTGFSLPTNMPPVTDLCFWGVRKGTNSVAMGIAWPVSSIFTNGCIDIYGNWRLSSNAWSRLAQVDVGSANSNAVVELPFSSFPTNAMEETAFFAAADRADSDGDGIPDTYERLVSGSSPVIADTDGDGIPDGDEVEFGTNPNLADTDGDGLPDSAEVGVVEVLPSSRTRWPVMGNPVSIWPSTTVSDIGTFLVNLPYPYTVNGVTYSQLRVCTDGVSYLLNPECPNWWYEYFFLSPPSLASDEMSERHVAVAWFCDDLYIKAGSWQSSGTYGTTTLLSGPASVIDLNYIGFADDAQSQQPHCFSCQMILPSGEPNVIYLTYWRMSPHSYFAARNPAIGVQHPGLSPLHAGEAFYNLTRRPTSDSFSKMRSVKFTIGTGTDPSSSDTDGDGLSDFEEATLFHTDPLAPDDDTDADGLPDAVELRIGSDPAVSDTDRDGIDDLLEFTIGTNPIQPDSDGDGMNDGWEYRYGFDPAVDNAIDTNPNNDIDADPDEDGLTNGQECEWGTNPGVPDTDGDEVGDGTEVAQNSDPSDVSDGGAPNSRIQLSFYFGDPSWSHSEKYRLTVTPTEGIGSAPASFSWLNENYGECETKTAMLKPGWKYEVRLYHAGTNISNGSPDYDYELNFTTNALSANVVVSDPDGLFGTDETSTSFGGEGKVAFVYVLTPPVISAPSAVGVNNDDDNGNGTPDCEDVGTVVGDDDFAELRISVLCPSDMHGSLEVTPLIGVTSGMMWKDSGRVRRFDVPETVAVSAGVTNLAYFAEGCNPSSLYEAEGVHAVFRCGGIALTNEFRFTFVERIAEPITTVRSGGQIVNPCCAVIGGTTKLKVEVLPSDFPESKIDWRVVSGHGSLTDATGREAAFVASGDADEDAVVQVDVGDCPGRAPQFTMLTTTMHEVKIYPCAISRMGRPPPITASQINSMLDEVNVIYRQVGLRFSLGASLICVTNEIWSRDGLIDNGVGAQIRNIMSNTDGLEIYFISGNDDAEDEPLGRHNPYGIIVKTSANAKTLAHEIGHACGWGDIYFKNVNDIIADLYGGARLPWMPLDWNNGTGCRFYDSLLTQYQIIQRLLMLGTGSDSKCDIPAGSVHGRSADGGMGNISVGRSMMTTSPHSL